MVGLSNPVFGFLRVSVQKFTLPLRPAVSVIVIVYSTWYGFSGLFDGVAITGFGLKVTAIAARSGTGGVAATTGVVGLLPPPQAGNNARATRNTSRNRTLFMGPPFSLRL